MDFGPNLLILKKNVYTFSVYIHVVVYIYIYIYASSEVADKFYLVDLLTFIGRT